VDTAYTSKLQVGSTLYLGSYEIASTDWDDSPYCEQYYGPVTLRYYNYNHTYNAVQPTISISNSN
jgi:hypothetical protein